MNKFWWRILDVIFWLVIVFGALVVVGLIAGCAPLPRPEAQFLFQDADQTPSPANPQWEGEFVLSSDYRLVSKYDPVIGAYSIRGQDGQVTMVLHLDDGNDDFAHAIICISGECSSSLLRFEDGCFADVFSNLVACRVE